MESVHWSYCRETVSRASRVSDIYIVTIVKAVIMSLILTWITEQPKNDMSDRRKKFDSS